DGSSSSSRLGNGMQAVPPPYSRPTEDVPLQAVRQISRLGRIQTRKRKCTFGDRGTEPLHHDSASPGSKRTNRCAAAGVFMVTTIPLFRLSSALLLPIRLGSCGSPGPSCVRNGSLIVVFDDPCRVHLPPLSLGFEAPAQPQATVPQCQTPYAPTDSPA